MAIVRRTQAIRRTVGVLAVGVIALAACGGSGTSNGKLRDAVKTAIIASAADSSSGSSLSVSDTEATCIADAVLTDKDAATALDKANTEGKTGQDLLGAVDSKNPKFMKSAFMCLDIEKIVKQFLGTQANSAQSKCVIDAFKKVKKSDLAEALAAAGSQTTDNTSPATQALTEKLMSDFAACAMSGAGGVPSGS